MAKMLTIGEIANILSTWETLNEYIVDASEKNCNELLTAELEGKARQMFVLRIHSRMNRMRALRERIELKERIKK
jgi:hypothetical protein